MRSLRVLLVGDHALAVDAAGDALQAITGVDVVARTSWAAAGTRPNGEVDVVVLEQSLAEPVTPERIREVASTYPGARLVSIALRDGAAYRWVRIRPAGAWFEIEETGEGRLQRALLGLHRVATAPHAVSPAIPRSTA
jgi:hypothetical protein